MQTFLDGGKDGVVYFSLGTNIPAEVLNEKRDMFLKAFKRLAPVKILWKYGEEHFPGKPDNVKVSKWVPQNDVLGKRMKFIFGKAKRGRRKNISSYLNVHIV